jgi:hypothetical protein
MTDVVAAWAAPAASTRTKTPASAPTKSLRIATFMMSTLALARNREAPSQRTRECPPVYSARRPRGPPVRLTLPQSFIRRVRDGSRLSGRPDSADTSGRLSTRSGAKGTRCQLRRARKRLWHIAKSTTAACFLSRPCPVPAERQHPAGAVSDRHGRARGDQRHRLAARDPHGGSFFGAPTTASRCATRQRPQRFG